jgi:hypothetical protein
MTWTYSGTCTTGDCGVVPTITGTVTGDPTVVPPPDELGQLLNIIGDLTSYSFTLGTYHFSGSTALGSYQLDASGNIIGGAMVFGNFLQLDLVGVGVASWAFTDIDCVFLDQGCRKTVDAAGIGSYALDPSVPEPGSLSLLAAGLIAVGLLRRPGKRARATLR